MTTLPAIHLAIMQPAGYVHSLGFLDQARYFRHQFRRLGAHVTMAKNRLREDAVNVVFGAHLGFPTDWLARHACLFVNLEQLGDGGAAVSADYLALLRRSRVVDYDVANVAAYAADPATVPVVPFGYAAYLDRGALPLEERPIDLLFFGSMNPRRQQFIARVEAAGCSVSVFDHPVYGAERDHFISQAKAVLNCHFYDSNRFEQARAFHCLSLGTPLISERTPTTAPSAAFEDSVLWLPEQVEAWFARHFAQPAFYAEARRALAAFRTPDAAHDPLPAYAAVLAEAGRLAAAHRQAGPREPWRPRAIHLGAGQDYRAAWLNIDADERAQADLPLDLSQPLALPVEATTGFGSPVLIEAGRVELIHAGDAVTRAADLRTLMDNALALLQEGGALSLEVPHAQALAAWQDPSSRRALNENSWRCCTDDFWQLGWFEHRFEVAQAQWLDAERQPAGKEQATHMRVVLRKIPTTPRERTLARTMQADFGGIDDDTDLAADTAEAMPSPVAVPPPVPAVARLDTSLRSRPPVAPMAAAAAPVPRPMPPLPTPVAARPESPPWLRPAAEPGRASATPDPDRLPDSLLALLLDE